MKIKKFNYNDSLRELLVLNEDEKYIQGIDLSKLSQDEKKELEKIIEFYEKKMKPFKEKAYRKFILEKIEELLEDNVSYKEEEK